MRGKDTGLTGGTKDEGITPAYAGKSTQIFGNCFFDQDHPRLCGEKAFGNSLLHRYIGSPPPMRGKDIEILKSVIVCRITPAYAGKRKKQKGN